jgi:dTDP-4-amino-4,6-dideoxygalactose transaminase
MRDGGRRGGQVSYSEGINSRLDEMQACYLRAFLPKLDEWNQWRRRIAAAYDEMLADIDGVRPVQTSAESVRHLYVVRAKKRDALRAFLAKRGVGTGVHYPAPLHRMPAFQQAGMRRGDLPVAEKACREVLSLPVWPYMAEDQVRYAAECVRAFYH